MKTYDIKLFGIGSLKYRALKHNLLKTIEILKIQPTIEQIQDVETFMQYEIQAIPALMINDKVEITGREATIQELKELMNAQQDVF